MASKSEKWLKRRNETQTAANQAILERPSLKLTIAGSVHTIGSVDDNGKLLMAVNTIQLDTANLLLFAQWIIENFGEEMD